MLNEQIKNEEDRVVEAMVAGDMAGMLKARARLARLEKDLKNLNAALASVRIFRKAGV